MLSTVFLVPAKGFEPPTPCFVDKCSNPTELRGHKLFGTLYGNRTRLCDLKGHCPKPIDEQSII